MGGVYVCKQKHPQTMLPAAIVFTFQTRLENSIQYALYNCSGKFFRSDPNATRQFLKEEPFGTV